MIETIGLTRTKISDLPLSLEDLPLRRFGFNVNDAIMAFPTRLYTGDRVVPSRKCLGDESGALGFFDFIDRASVSDDSILFCSPGDRKIKGAARWLYHRYNILTGISNGQEFQLHPCYGLNFQRVRAQRAKSSARQIAWLDKSYVWVGLCNAKAGKLSVQRRIQSTR